MDKTKLTIRAQRPPRDWWNIQQVGVRDAAKYIDLVARAQLEPSGTAGCPCFPHTDVWCHPSYRCLMTPTWGIPQLLLKYLVGFTHERTSAPRVQVFCGPSEEPCYGKGASLDHRSALTIIIRDGGWVVRKLSTKTR